MKPPTVQLSERRLVGFDRLFATVTQFERGDAGFVGALDKAEVDRQKTKRRADTKPLSRAGLCALDDLPAAFTRRLAHQIQHALHPRGGLLIFPFGFIEQDRPSIPIKRLADAGFGRLRLDKQRHLAKCGADDVVHQPRLAGLRSANGPDGRSPLQAATDCGGDDPAREKQAVNLRLPGRTLTEFQQLCRVRIAQRRCDLVDQARASFIDVAATLQTKRRFNAVDEKNIAEMKHRPALVDPGAAAADQIRIVDPGEPAAVAQPVSRAVPVDTAISVREATFVPE